MSCECTDFICLEVLYNPCSEGAELNIVATETATWSADIYFNGMPTEFSFGVTQDEKIIIPSALLNEYYTHEFRLYNGGGILLDCYHLKSRASNNAGEFTPIPPLPNEVSAKTFEGNETSTQNFPGIGEPIFRISIGNQVYMEGFDQDGETITMHDDVLFYGTIVIEWENT